MYKLLDQKKIIMLILSPNFSSKHHIQSVRRGCGQQRRACVKISAMRRTASSLAKANFAWGQLRCVVICRRTSASGMRLSKKAYLDGDRWPKSMAYIRVIQGLYHNCHAIHLKSRNVQEMEVRNTRIIKNLLSLSLSKNIWPSII